MVVGSPPAIGAERSRPLLRYSNRSEPSQASESVTSLVTCRASPCSRPAGSTSTTQATDSTTNASMRPSGDHTGPSSPRVEIDRPGIASV